MAAHIALQLPGALFLGFAFFSLLPHIYFTLIPLRYQAPCPKAVSRALQPRHLAELARAATAQPGTAAPAQLLTPAPSSCSPCESLHSVTARLQSLLSPSQSRALSYVYSQNQSLLQIQNLIIISNKLLTSGFYFEVHNSTVFFASAPSKNSKRQRQDAQITACTSFKFSTQNYIGSSKANPDFWIFFVLHFCL